jgi:hypothetical protein
MNELAAMLADVKSLVDETRSRRSASGVETVTIPLLARGQRCGLRRNSGVAECAIRH